MVEQIVHSSSNTTKLLSVVLSGRNDEYMGNFKYRITTCLNYLARNLNDCGRLDDIEVIVTDWGSDIPLAKVLPFSPEAGRICRFVYVPPSISRTVRPDGGFATYWAANTGLRRGQGEFLLLSDADNLFPRHSLRMLLALLDGKIDLPFDIKRIFFFLCRHQIPWEIVHREPTLEEWDRYLLLSAGSLPRDQGMPGLGIVSAGQMMYRSMWHECRANNQHLVGQAWGDAELTLRVTQCYPWMDLSSIGVSLFHMQHWPHNRPGTWPNAVINPYIVSPTMQVNDENWGLANYELDIQTAENIVEPSRITKSSVTVGQVEPWNKMRGELVAELTSPSVREHVLGTTQRWDLDTAEWESLCSLSWYSLHHYPRAYLEFGIQNANAAVVVAAACPGVEIHGIDAWQGSGSRPGCSPDHVTGMLQRIGYRGYMRLVTGEPSTAFRRLRDSFVGPLSLDITLVRGDMFGADAIQQLSDLVPHLAPGGMLVFTCGSVVDFQHVLREMHVKFPSFTYLQCNSGKTGLILVATLKNDGLGVPADSESSIRVDFGKPPQPALTWSFRKVFRALRNPTKYPEYARRICRFLLSR